MASRTHKWKVRFQDLLKSHKKSKMKRKTETKWLKNTVWKSNRDSRKWAGLTSLTKKLWALTGKEAEMRMFSNLRRTGVDPSLARISLMGTREFLIIRKGK